MNTPVASNASSGRSLASRFRDAKHDTMLLGSHSGWGSHKNDNAASLSKHSIYVLVKQKKKISRFP